MAKEPSWLQVARGEIGVKESPGAANNPKVVEYLKTSGNNHPDSVAWCKGFVNWCLNKAGYRDDDSLWARDGLKYGGPLDKPQVGCIAVYSRGDGGHIGFWVSEDSKNDYIVGGNQSDMVSIAPIAKSRLLGYRWPTVADKLTQATPVELPKAPEENQKKSLWGIIFEFIKRIFQYVR